MKHNGSWRHLLMGLLVFGIVMPAQAFGEDSAPAFRQEELDQMLAPIALYPDSLLAQILMGATYPLEIVLADRWRKEHGHLRGDALNDALDRQNWDPSVKALIPFPSVLAMMSEKIDWTQRLGEAFLAQEPDVMNTVQQLRARAYAAGNLRSGRELTVSNEGDTIIIQPYSPQVVYVPVYDPWVIYGSWWWPYHPPYIVHHHHRPPDVVIAPSAIWFGVGFSVGAFWGHGWGHWDWGHHRVYVNVNHRVNINRPLHMRPEEIRTAPWQHNREHRRGVVYRVPAARDRFAPVNRQAVDYRRNDRGFAGSRPMASSPGILKPAQVTRPNQSVTHASSQTNSPATVGRLRQPAKKVAGTTRPAQGNGIRREIARVSPHQKHDTAARRPSSITQTEKNAAPPPAAPAYGSLQRSGSPGKRAGSQEHLSASRHGSTSQPSPASSARNGSRRGDRRGIAASSQFPSPRQKIAAASRVAIF